MNWADFAIIGILVFSGLISFWRGFVKEALSLAGWALALFIALSFRAPMAQLLADHIEAPSLRVIVAFAILFIATLIVVGLINHLIAKLVEVSGLSGTDRFLGFLFGVIRGAIVVLVIVLLVPGFVPIDQDAWWQESLLIPHFVGMKEFALELFDAVGNLFDGSQTASGSA